jgi:hypothetical protein
MENILKTIVPFLQGMSLNDTNAWMVRQTDDLQEKYNWLKSSERDAEMGVLSATNRRLLVLSPGTYTLTATLTLDTEFVDIISISNDPKDTIVTRGTGGHTVEQTANDITMRGFTIKNTGTVIGDHAFVINATNNTPSLYEYMHFFQVNTYQVPEKTRYPINSISDIYGTWYFCICSDYGWQLANDKTLGANMDFCTGGIKSFGGDNPGATISGHLRNCVSGDQGFGGCLTYGIDITGILEDCTAGDNSYALGKTFSGIARRCVGGVKCFAGYKGTLDYYGTFSGYAEDCTASGASFGSGHASCKNSGEIVRCRCTSMVEAMFCEGAKIKDSYLQITTADKSCLDLNDGNTKVYNSTLIANGTGKSITAGEAQNVLALHCRMNLDKHANVTNLVGDGSLAAGYCIVNAAVS